MVLSEKKWEKASKNSGKHPKLNLDMSGLSFLHPFLHVSTLPLRPSDSGPIICRNSLVHCPGLRIFIHVTLSVQNWGYYMGIAGHDITMVD